jgi:hypothetical protein
MRWLSSRVDVNAFAIRSPNVYTDYYRCNAVATNDRECSVRLRRLCSATIQDKKKFEQSLLLVRRRGYVFTQEELYRGAWGLAAPILDENGAAIASLAITGVNFRPPQKRLPRFIAMIRQAAREISERLTKIAPTEQANANEQLIRRERYGKRSA